MTRWPSCSTRFAFKVLAAAFNHDSVEIGADPVHLMFVLEQAIRRDQLPPDVEKRYLEFIKAELAPRFDAVREAVLTAPRDTASLRGEIVIRR